MSRQPTQSIGTMILSSGDTVARRRELLRGYQRHCRARKRKERERWKQRLARNPRSHEAQSRISDYEQKERDNRKANARAQRIRRATVVGKVPRAILDRIDSVSTDASGNSCVVLVKLPKQVLKASKLLLVPDGSRYRIGLEKKLSTIQGLQNFTVKDGNGLNALSRYVDRASHRVGSALSKADGLIRECLFAGLTSMGAMDPKKQGISYIIPSVMKSCSTVIPQPAHTDIIVERGDRRRPSSRLRCKQLSEHQKRINIAIYPISTEGSLLNIWREHVDVPVEPVLVYIPYGYMLVASSHVTHGGGLLTPDSRLGNPRVHLFVHKDPGYATGLDFQSQYHCDETKYVEACQTDDIEWKKDAAELVGSWKK